MLFFLVIVGIVTYIFLSLYYKTKKLPPGPTPLPLLGNLLQIGKGVVAHGGIVPLMMKWKEEYGDVYTIWFGTIPSVIIGDWQIAYDAMVKQGTNFADKTVPFMFNIERNNRGIIIANGQHWSEQRRFSLHAMRNFGLGKDMMEDRIMLEFNNRRALINKEIAGSDGKLSFDLYETLEKTMGNVMNRMMFSESFSEEKETRYYDLKKEMEYLVKKQSLFDLWIRDWNSNIPPFKKRKEEISQFVKKWIALLREQIDERKEKIASGQHLLRDEGEDLVDAFLIEMQKKDHGDSFNDGSLEITLMDLWAAGQDSTTVATYWAFNYILLHPEVLEKLQNELISIADGRQLSLSDRPRTPYFNATISEIVRLASIVPVNFTKDALEDTVVGGYLIPKGTPVVAQLSVLDLDPKHFEEAEKFNPDRFLQPGVEQYSVPFGMGKRACLGESLARAQLYLVIGNMLLEYNLEVDPAHPPSMKPLAASASIRRPNPYNIVVSKRNNKV